jgi:hypothetical protein
MMPPTDAEMMSAMTDPQAMQSETAGDAIPWSGCRVSEGQHAHSRTKDNQ